MSQSSSSSSTEEEQSTRDERAEVNSSPSWECPGFPPLEDWRLGLPTDQFGLVLYESVRDFDNDSRGYSRCIPLLKNLKKWILKEDFRDIRRRYNSIPDLLSSRCIENYKIRNEALNFKRVRESPQSSWSLLKRSASTSNMESLDYVDFIDDSRLYDEYDDLINEHSQQKFFNRRMYTY